MDALSAAGEGAGFRGRLLGSSTVQRQSKFVVVSIAHAPFLLLFLHCAIKAVQFQSVC